MKFTFMHKMTRYSIDLIGDLDDHMFYAVTDANGKVTNRKTKIKYSILGTPESRYFTAKLADGSTAKLYIKDIPFYEQECMHS